MSEQDDTVMRLSRRQVLAGLAAAGGGLVAAGASASQATEAAAKPAGLALPPTTRRELSAAIKGATIWQGEDGYEDARGAAVWRMNKPPRYPAVVVIPENAADVQAAVKFAKRNHLKVGTRSGGHSWMSPHVREGAMLLDLRRLKDIKVDKQSQSVWTGPSNWGMAVNAALGNEGLITPTAHHVDVGIGGFVLCGGFGWNSRLWGNGCTHIEALDVVTADGDLIRADANNNADYYWAARGGGAGFFGVVTALKLAAHPLPPAWKVSVYSYPIEEFEAVFTWARNIVDQVPRYVELVITTSPHNEAGDWAPLRITVAALAIADSDALADAGLDILNTCPVVDKAIKRKDKLPTNLAERYASGMMADPPGHRFAADNMYTRAPADKLVPRIKDVFTKHPSPRTHTFWMSWGPVKPLPDMAFSVQDDVFIATYTVWDDPRDDAKMERWPVEQLRKLDDLSTGAQMNDENMARHPQKYLSDKARARLEKLRGKHDPERRFVGYLTPGEVQG